jgi:hypothetical protein
MTQYKLVNNSKNFWRAYCFYLQDMYFSRILKCRDPEAGSIKLLRNVGYSITSYNTWIFIFNELLPTAVTVSGQLLMSDCSASCSCKTHPKSDIHSTSSYSLHRHVKFMPSPVPESPFYHLLGLLLTPRLRGLLPHVNPALFTRFLPRLYKYSHILFFSTDQI